MANTPAKKKTAKSTTVEDVRDVEYAEDSFTAKIFDEDQPFMFSTDVNAFILSGAMSGGVESIGAMRRLLMSLVLVPDADEADDLELARLNERQRFVDVMERQQGLSMERLAGMLGDVLEAAGNATGD